MGESVTRKRTFLNFTQNGLVNGTTARLNWAVMSKRIETLNDLPDSAILRRGTYKRKEGKKSMPYIIAEIPAEKAIAGLDNTTLSKLCAAPRKVEEALEKESPENWNTRNITNVLGDLQVAQDQKLALPMVVLFTFQGQKIHAHGFTSCRSPRVQKNLSFTDIAQNTRGLVNGQLPVAELKWVAPGTVNAATRLKSQVTIEDDEKKKHVLQAPYDWLVYFTDSEDRSLSVEKQAQRATELLRSGAKVAELQYLCSDLGRGDGGAAMEQSTEQQPSMIGENLTRVLFRVSMERLAEKDVSMVMIHAAGGFIANTGERTFAERNKGLQRVYKDYGATSLWLVRSSVAKKPGQAPSPSKPSSSSSSRPVPSGMAGLRASGESSAFGNLVTEFSDAQQEAIVGFLDKHRKALENPDNVDGYSHGLTSRFVDKPSIRDELDAIRQQAGIDLEENEANGLYFWQVYELPKPRAEKPKKQRARPKQSSGGKNGNNNSSKQAKAKPKPKRSSSSSNKSNGSSSSIGSGGRKPAPVSQLSTAQKLPMASKPKDVSSTPGALVGNKGERNAPFSKAAWMTHQLTQGDRQEAIEYKTGSGQTVSDRRFPGDAISRKKAWAQYLRYALRSTRNSEWHIREDAALVLRAAVENYLLNWIYYASLIRGETIVNLVPQTDKEKKEGKSREFEIVSVSDAYQSGHARLTWKDLCLARAILEGQLHDARVMDAVDKNSGATERLLKRREQRQ